MTLYSALIRAVQVVHAERKLETRYGWLGLVFQVALPMLL
jgi:uncharacterized membrane protein